MRREESLWITVVIHGDLGVGNSDSPTPFRACYNIYIYEYQYLFHDNFNLKSFALRDPFHLE